MNQLVGKLLPGHGSRVHIVSLDIFHYIDLLDKSQWTDVAEFILGGVHQLVQSGIDFVLVCSNTGRDTFALDRPFTPLVLGHIAAPRIMEYYPDLVFLHISDAVAFAIKQKKFRKVGYRRILEQTERCE
jgi:aspartate/glutamate racemase